jgi:hypothetical protein
MTDAARKTVFGPHVERQNELHASIIRIEKELKSLGDPETAAADLAAHSASNAAHASETKKLAAMIEQQASLREAQGRQDSNAAGTVDELRAELDSLKKRIVAGLEKLVAAVQSEETQKTYDRQLKERQQAERRASEIEKLLEYFGPRGIKAKLISERLDLFTDRVNTVLDWWGYSLGFSIEPYSLRITETGSNAALTPNQLSASERYRLGIAFAAAISEWTNLRMLIADGADILDKTDKWRLAEALFQSDLEQVIVTSTGVAGTFEAAGSAFYTLSKTEGITATQLDAQNAEEQAMVLSQ